MGKELRNRLVARWRASELDHALACGIRPSPDGPLALHARRVMENRRSLGETIAGCLVPSRGPSARVRPDLPAVADARSELRLLADRLMSDEPVDVRGVARARVLLSDGAGPLYWSGSTRALRNEVREALGTL